MTRGTCPLQQKNHRSGELPHTQSLIGHQLCLKEFLVEILYMKVCILTHVYYTVYYLCKLYHVGDVEDLTVCTCNKCINCVEEVGDVHLIHVLNVI